MSKIVSPWPPLPSEHCPPGPQARWWRFFLLSDLTDGAVFGLETDAPGDGMDGATWVSFNFFDGENQVIDAASCVINRACMTDTGAGMAIDVLCVDAPTGSPHWLRLTDPGESGHPNEDRIVINLHGLPPWD